MGVFDDDEIRRSPADCLLLLYTHLWEAGHMCTHTHAQLHTAAYTLVL